MDARNRLNQLNKNKRFNKGKGKVNDLRQLISFPGKKGTNVRARIGFTSKSRQQRQIMSQNNRVQKARNRGGKNITLAGPKHAFPKVTVRNQKPKFNERKRDFGRNRISRQRNIVDNAQLNNESLQSSGLIPQLFSSGNVPVIIMQQPSVSNLSMDTEPQPSTSTRSMAVKQSYSTVIVSNLNQISESDIRELFGEIGALVDINMINSSMVLVTYNNADDARNACQTYNNRLLDGYPMQCNILPDTSKYKPEIQLPLSSRLGPNPNPVRPQPKTQPQPQSQQRFRSSQRFTQRSPQRFTQRSPQRFTQRSSQGIASSQKFRSQNFRSNFRGPRRDNVKFTVKI